MEQYCVSNIKSSWQDNFLQILSENTFKMLLKIAAAQERIYYCKMESIFDIGAWMFSIAPRSPGINAIENFFHLVKNQLNRDALKQKIRQENYQQFLDLVKETILNFPVGTTDNIILSMEK